MVPLEHVHQQHRERAFEFVVFVPPHVENLLGDISRVDLGEAAFLEKSSLLERPGIEVALIERRERGSLVDVAWDMLSYSYQNAALKP